MQLEVQRRFTNGFYFQTQYELTACHDLGPPTGAGPIVINDPHRDYGNCPYISRQALVTNYTYDLPFGAGRRWLKTGLPSTVVGGWSVSGISVYQTGPAFSVTFTSPTSYPGWIASRADVVPGVDPYLKNHSHSPTASWLNPAAFIAPAPGQWGHARRPAARSLCRLPRSRVSDQEHAALRRPDPGRHRSAPVTVTEPSELLSPSPGFCPMLSSTTTKASGLMVKLMSGPSSS